MLLYTIALPVLPKLKTCIDKECQSSAYLIHRTLRPATYRNKKLKAFPIIPGFECFSGEQGDHKQAGVTFVKLVFHECSSKRIVA